MGKTSLKHSIPLVALLMLLALIGWPVIEFLTTAIMAISVGAILLYAFMGFLYGVDRVLDWLYTAR
jgi:hypothetical protein